MDSPAKVVIKDGKITATVVWSSPNYDYMLVDGTKYLNENKGGNSTFTIPVSGFDCDIAVVGDTVAMRTKINTNKALELMKKTNYDSERYLYTSSDSLCLWYKEAGEKSRYRRF